jgi:hypothetical protein
MLLKGTSDIALGGFGFPDREAASSTLSRQV